MRKELAYRLSLLWKRLGVTYAKYAEGRPVDSSTINRYVNARRRPPAWFISALLRDVESAGFAVPQAERDHLFELRELLVPTTKQELQDELESLDAEHRACQDRQAKSAADLRTAQALLGQRNAQLSALRERLKAGSRAHTAETARMLGEYQRVEAERDTLREQVDDLREALFHAQSCTEQAEAESRQLRVLLRELQRYWEGDAGPITGLPDVKNVPMDDLMNVVTDTAKRSPSLVPEVLRRVHRLRPLAEAIVLFAALEDLGRRDLAELALPSLVLGRTPQQICDLLDGLLLRRLETFGAVVVQVAAQCLSCRDLLLLTRRLHDRNLVDLAGVVAAAAAARFPPAEVADMLDELIRAPQLEVAAKTAAIGAVRNQLADHLAELIKRLFTLGHHGYSRELVETALRERNTQDIPSLLSALSDQGLDRLTEDALDQTARYGTPQTLTGLIPVLHVQLQAGTGSGRWWLPVLSQSATNIAELITGLDRAMQPALAQDVLGECLKRCSPTSSRVLFNALHKESPKDMSRLLERHTQTLPMGEMRELVHLVGNAHFQALALSMVMDSARYRPPSEVADLILALPLEAYEPHEVTGLVSAVSAAEMTPTVGKLICALWRTGYADLSTVLFRRVTASRNGTWTPVPDLETQGLLEWLQENRIAEVPEDAREEPFDTSHRGMSTKRTRSLLRRGGGRHRRW